MTQPVEPSEPRSMPPEPEPERSEQPVADQPPPQAPPAPPAYASAGQQPWSGAPVAQPPMAPGDARLWSVFAHLGGTFLSFLVPLVIYLVFKDRDPFVRRHSSQALNFHITLAIVYIVSIPLMFVIIGIFTFLAAVVCALVFTIMAAVAANDGRDYTYPLAIQFVH